MSAKLFQNKVGLGLQKGFGRRGAWGALGLSLWLASCATHNTPATHNAPATHEALGLNNTPAPSQELPSLSQLPDTLENQPPFTCVFEREQISPGEADADKLFKHAHWLHKKNPSKEDKATIERLYRIAAAWGHDRAAHSLALLLISDDSEAGDRTTKPLEVAKELISRGIPHGYYLRALLWLKGISEEGDTHGYWQYLRRAADLGNPVAQADLGFNLYGRFNSLELSEQMLLCAAEQGHPLMTSLMADWLRRNRKYEEAIQHLQRVVKTGGNTTGHFDWAAYAASAAYKLYRAFSGVAAEPDDEDFLGDEDFWGLAEDEERARRYLKLSELFFNKEHTPPTADEIDTILPLPPAPLPAWDGKATPWSSPLPSEERIEEMALAKGLNPKTGWPKGLEASTEKLPSGTQSHAPSDEAPKPIEEQRTFTCTFEKERIPKRNAEADKLFEHAHGLHKQNRHKGDEKAYLEIERLYRIAAAWGHDKAAVFLVEMMMEGHTAYTRTKPVEIAEELMRRGIPSGHYLMGRLLEKGHGIPKNTITAQGHFWDAAHLGNPEAQYVLGNSFFEDMGMQMLRCAAEQGHADATYKVAERLQAQKKYGEAVEYYQLAVKRGSRSAASTLESGFRFPYPGSASYLGLAGNEKRAMRYKHISELLYYNETNVDDIEQIVPLPPAKLPAWDGKLKRKEAPALPSEKQVAKMAQAKKLYPENGWPLVKNIANIPLEELPGTLKGQLPFSCVHEKTRLPKRNADADILFRHANWLQHHRNRSEDAVSAEQLYRIAAAWGHEKAANNLVVMMMDKLSHNKGVDGRSLPLGLAESLIHRGIPLGYYWMGRLLDTGYGVKKDTEAAIRYFRKAADWGNPEAQYFLANSLSNEVGMQMLRCAADQGEARAASMLSRHLREKKKYAEALKYLQKAAKAGDRFAAQALQKAFSNPPPKDEWDYYGQAEDKERAKRYEKIEKTLALDSYAKEGYDFEGAKAIVSEIDKIVPLPPAKLPPWNGAIKWKKRKDEPPPLLSQKRIAEMARAKGLEPGTGRPKKKIVRGSHEDLSNIARTQEEQWPFVCTTGKDRMLQHNAEADKLFEHAFWLMEQSEKQRHREHRESHAEIERLYRIAAAWGHEKAAYELVQMMVHGQAAYSRHSSKPFEIAEELIRRGAPQGYFLMGSLLKQGYGRGDGLYEPLQYFRKAADLGDVEAQYFLKRELSGELSKAMQHCAAKQGHFEEAYEVAKVLKDEKKYAEALQYFHMALKAGNRWAAYELQKAFSGVAPSHEDYMGQARDEEREKRYVKIYEAFKAFSPSFYQEKSWGPIEEIDKIVPLPPAKLPPWNGEIEWVKKLEGNALPPLPEAEHIKEMALKKGLHPETGLPIHKKTK